ncbi:MAG: MBL fold metallo-hydrolase [Bacteriovoracaceae bacterium]
MISRKIFDDGDHAWIALGRDPNKPDEIIDTNEYAIISGDEVMLLDPGGTEIFPSVLSTMTENIRLENVKKLLCSHQDPDILSSMPLWLGLCPEAKVYIPWVWQGFIPHFGKECANNFEIVPDKELTIPIGNNGKEVKIIPAHFLHSPGNLNLYDPSSKILFSGDIGSALVPADSSLFVDDFEKHVQYMEKFHIRWMPSNEHKKVWINRIRRLSPDMICPQHGSIFTGKDVQRFLDWLETLDVGKY